MTEPFGTTPLLSSDDLTSFQASDPDWFLAAAGDTIRNFCQWHIYPSISETAWVPIQPDGTIMLPTMFLTDVATVTMGGIELDPTSYQMHQAGFIKHFRQQFFDWPLWPLEDDTPFHEYPSALARFAQVTFTHGYSTLPPTVAAVGMELANRAMELPSGIATQISSGPYSISMGALGVVLSDDQRRRLGPFTLVRF